MKMSVTTKRTEISRKQRQFSAVCVGAISLIASLSAKAAFVISSGGAIQGLPVPANDFNSNLSGRGFNQMTTGAQLSVDMDGAVTFYYLAAESAYTNSFNSGSSSSITESNDAFDWDGWDSFTINVTAGEILDFSFASASASALAPVDNAGGNNLYGLGILTSTTTSDLVLAYNDNLPGTGDSDYDDMLVRAAFSTVAVPLPAAAWLFGSGLLALLGMARYRKH
jgi:hypothetical protein